MDLKGTLLRVGTDMLGQVNVGLVTSFYSKQSKEIVGYRHHGKKSSPQKKTPQKTPPSEAYHSHGEVACTGQSNRVGGSTCDSGGAERESRAGGR